MKVQCKNCIKSLSDISRLEIYDLVSNSTELSVSEIVLKLKNIKQPTVSYHLKELQKGGLVTSRKEGKKVYYKISKICPHYKEVCILQA